MAAENKETKTKPTIKTDYEKFDVWYDAACSEAISRILNRSKAPAIKDFLAVEGLPAYFKALGNFELFMNGRGDCQGKEMQHYLLEARKALIEAKETYVHDPEDIATFGVLEERVEASFYLAELSYGPKQFEAERMTTD